MFTKLIDKVIFFNKMDDIIVYSSNFKEHIEQMEEVMIRFQRA